MYVCPQKHENYYKKKMKITINDVSMIFPPPRTVNRGYNSSSQRYSGGLMDKVSALQPQDHGFEPHMGHDHVQVTYPGD